MCVKIPSCARLQVYMLTSMNRTLYSPSTLLLNLIKARHTLLVIKCTTPSYNRQTYKPRQDHAPLTSMTPRTMAVGMTTAMKTGVQITMTTTPASVDTMMYTMNRITSGSRLSSMSISLENLKYGVFFCIIYFISLMYSFMCSCIHSCTHVIIK